MEYFLENIAKSLHNEFAGTLNRHCLVFPSRRAGLYFIKYLAARIEKPVWTPSIFTINELFRSFSTLQMAGPEILLFELYKVYRKIKKSPESFDDFYFWGDMLLNDFDDVDKYIVDAFHLFSNVLDIKNIDLQFGGLTEDQLKIIKRFWINFDPDKITNEKKGFLSIWSVLFDIYSTFRISLREQNIAYEGMIFREVAENFQKDIMSLMRWDIIHFIGFNALNECEKTIMSCLKKIGKARFYWDYDNSFLSEGQLNSAGFFLKDNIKLYGNDMTPEWSHDINVSDRYNSAKRRVIDTSSDIAQVKLIPQLIGDLPGLTMENAHHTAVVLADENLLMPVLTSLPENMGDINITMGYPLRLTNVYTFVKHLMDLQITSTIENDVVRFNFIHVISILKHTLISGLSGNSDKAIITEIIKSNLVWVPADHFEKSEYLSRLFRKPSTSFLLSEYFKEVLSMIAISDKHEDLSENDSVQRNIINEFIYRIVLSLNRLETIVGSHDIAITIDTYIRILDRMLRIQSVPFSGEPLSGIQIMGILETRALDFKNLIFLSVNEGILPAISSGSSFIPFSLRDAFCLPSLSHQESIYAYHFYRLLQRAENVTFTYNSNSEGLRSGEMSRFLIQMKYEQGMKTDFSNLNFEIRTQGSVKECLERSEQHSEQLYSLFIDGKKGGKLSPTAINTWLNCRMKFYYRYINMLKEPDKVFTDIDPALLGNILHEIMKSIYHDYIGIVLTQDLFNSIIRNKQLLARVIGKAISEKFKGGRDGSVGGNELIIREVLMAYLLRILHMDKNLAPITILHLEESFSFIIPVVLNGIQVDIVTGGQVDRIDITEDLTRIVDYKTGTVAETISSTDELFSDDRKKDPDGWLQTLFYCEAYLANKPYAKVQPSVYKIRKLAGDKFTDKLKIKSDRKTEIIIDDYKLVREEFVSGLKGIIATIFSSYEPFRMTKDIRGKCMYCTYKSLCMR